MQDDEDLYTKQIYCLGMWYNSLVGLEVNFSTYPTMELQRLEYPLLYVREVFDNIMTDHQMKYGFKTTSLTRPIIISNLVQIMREHIDKINDKSTLEEALSFVKIKGKPQASEGTHDDLIMALAIAYEILKQIPAPIEDKRTTDYDYEENYESDFFTYGG